MILGKGLRAKQKRFIELYYGDKRKAAIAANYKSPKYAANSLLKNSLVVERIKEREETNPDPLIMERIERMRYLTSVARDESIKVQERLKSVEILCKMNGDFIIKHEVSESNDDVYRQEVRAAAIEFFYNTQNAQRERINIDCFETDAIDKVEFIVH